MTFYDALTRRAPVDIKAVSEDIFQFLCDHAEKGFSLTNIAEAIKYTDVSLTEQYMDTIIQDRFQKCLDLVSRNGFQEETYLKYMLVKITNTPTLYAVYTFCDFQTLKSQIIFLLSFCYSHIHCVMPATVKGLVHMIFGMYDMLNRLGEKINCERIKKGLKKHSEQEITTELNRMCVEDKIVGKMDEGYYLKPFQPFFYTALLDAFEKFIEKESKKENND